MYFYADVDAKIHGGRSSPVGPIALLPHSKTTTAGLRCRYDEQPNKTREAIINGASVFRNSRALANTETGDARASFTRVLGRDRPVPPAHGHLRYLVEPTPGSVTHHADTGCARPGPIAPAGRLVAYASHPVMKTLPLRLCLPSPAVAGLFSLDPVRSSYPSVLKYTRSAHRRFWVMCCPLSNRCRGSPILLKIVVARRSVICKLRLRKRCSRIWPKRPP